VNQLGAWEAEEAARISWGRGKQGRQCESAGAWEAEAV
jgi:hypothetical protein